jgi:ATP-binding cassette subfamily F protein uup
MLAQRGADLTREAVKTDELKPSKQATSPAAPEQPKRRMSFKDKHALETLPANIARWQVEVAALQAQLDDSAFYTRDRAGFEKVTTKLGELQRKIAAAEEQWLELEILREELAGGETR